MPIKGKVIPGQALRIPGGCGFLISSQSVPEEMVRLLALSNGRLNLPPSPQEIFLVLTSVRG